MNTKVSNLCLSCALELVWFYFQGVSWPSFIVHSHVQIDLSVVDTPPFHLCSPNLISTPWNHIMETLHKSFHCFFIILGWFANAGSKAAVSAQMEWENKLHSVSHTGVFEKSKMSFFFNLQIEVSSHFYN